MRTGLSLRERCGVGLEALCSTRHANERNSFERTHTCRVNVSLMFAVFLQGHAWGEILMCGRSKCTKLVTEPARSINACPVKRPP